MPDTPVRIAVDAMGGDHAPDPILEGVAAALAADPALTVVLFGDASVVEPFADAHDRAVARATSEVIAMDEHGATAVRSKKDSSIVAGCRSVRDGDADGFFSAGNSGAVMAAATLVMGRLPGVSRPAIASVFPASSTPVVLLDIGATADCKAENLVEFGQMGAAYARIVLGVDSPRVRLLNIGEEPTKGSPLALEAHALMGERLEGFEGNIEGRDIPFGTTDVIVTDGFTGNVVLKLMEGVSKALLGEVRAVLTAGPVQKLAAAAVASDLKELRRRLDPDTYGGAPLLGVDGLCIIGHGSSSAAAVAAALGVASRAVRGGLVAAVADAVAESAG